MLPLTFFSTTRGSQKLTSAQRRAATRERLGNPAFPAYNPRLLNAAPETFPGSFHCSDFRFPISDFRFLIPNSQFPIPDS
jgi:hypothetical protein